MAASAATSCVAAARRRAGRGRPAPARAGSGGRPMRPSQPRPRGFAARPGPAASRPHPRRAPAARSCSYRATSPEPPRRSPLFSVGLRRFWAVGAGQRPFHRARVHPDPERCPRSRRPAARVRSDGSASRSCAGEGDDLGGELVRPPRARPGRHQPGQPGARRPRRRPGNTTAGRTRTPPPPGSPAGPSARTRRTISYLTCTRSRASKNSGPAVNASSATASGRGFRQRASRSAASFGSVPAAAPCRLPNHTM